MDVFLDKTIESILKHYNILLENDRSVPVENISLDHLKNSRVVFKQEVWAVLQNIALTTQVDKKEIGYFNKIILSNAPLKSIQTEFDQEITEHLKQSIDENLDERTVVAHGHSHPKISEKYEFFSVGDLACLYELTENVHDFKDKTMQLVGCLVTPDRPIQLMYYNPADCKFYDMERIEIEDENVL